MYILVNFLRKNTVVNFACKCWFRAKKPGASMILFWEATERDKIIRVKRIIQINITDIKIQMHLREFLNSQIWYPKLMNLFEMIFKLRLIFFLTFDLLSFRPYFLLHSKKIIRFVIWLFTQNCVEIYSVSVCISFRDSVLVTVDQIKKSRIKK